MSGIVLTVPNEALLVELDHLEDARAQLPEVHAGGELIAAVGGLGDRSRVRRGDVRLALELLVNLIAQLEPELEIFRRLNGATSRFHTQTCNGIVHYTNR